MLNSTGVVIGPPETSSLVCSGRWIVSAVSIQEFLAFHDIGDDDTGTLTRNSPSRAAPPHCVHIGAMTAPALEPVMTRGMMPCSRVLHAQMEQSSDAPPHQQQCRAAEAAGSAFQKVFALRSDFTRCQLR
jgi:hypothetical protein